MKLSRLVHACRSVAWAGLDNVVCLVNNHNRWLLPGFPQARLFRFREQICKQDFVIQQKHQSGAAEVWWAHNPQVQDRNLALIVFFLLGFSDIPLGYFSFQLGFWASIFRWTLSLLNSAAARKIGRHTLPQRA